MEVIFQLSKTIPCNPDLKVTSLRSGTEAHTLVLIPWSPQGCESSPPTCAAPLSMSLPQEVTLK